MTLTDTELEQLAKAATPGPWMLEADDGNEMRFISVMAGKIQVAFVDDFLEVGGWTCDQKDLRFIAAFNPAVALDLLTRLRAAERKGWNEAIEAAINQGFDPEMEVPDIIEQLNFLKRNPTNG